jgi:hypothetical protein
VTEYHYSEQVTQEIAGLKDRHSQPDPMALSTNSECAKPSVKSNQAMPKKRRNIEKEKFSEPSHSTEPAVDITRPRSQRKGSGRKRKAIINQEGSPPEIQLSTVVPTQETASLDHNPAIEPPSSRKRKSKPAMKTKETISGTRNPDETETKPKARKPKQCVIA